VTFLPDDLYATIERSIPIACVDFVPVRTTAEGDLEVGLILRESPYGRVWCHLGGRVRYGETIAAAIRRHGRDTLGVEPVLGDDPQPAYVYQWFPDAVRPESPETGRDERKHAIGLSYTVQLGSDAPTPRNEALDFSFFALAALPDPLWPGCERLIERMLFTRS
jgi:ADP-ribose pyrophosphatase YjhB (NUDIX family)